MMTYAQINALVNAMKWLTWLVGFSWVLVLNILLYGTSWQEYSNRPTAQSTEYSPVAKAQPVNVINPALIKGKDLFTANCQQCHEVATNTVVLGPSLLGVSSRVPSQQWFVNWIKDPSVLIESGDVYANTIVKKFAPVVMPSFTTLKDQDIKAIIDYINSHKSDDAAFTM